MNIHKAVEKELVSDARVECTLEFAQFLLGKLFEQTSMIKVPEKKAPAFRRYKNSLIVAERELENICNDK